MSNRILIPYCLTAEELSIIAQYFFTHTDWTRIIFNTIKQNIISHLRVQQSNLCCYCKYPLGFDLKQVDIEHIIPKSEYENFTFNPLNLALSCPACNTKKSTKPVLHSAIVHYPRDGSNFKIVHAHYDDYTTHIDILHNCVFVAKTTKGSETITYCELFRLGTVEKRAKAYQAATPNMLYQLVQDLKNANPKIKKELMDIIQASIR